MRSLLRFILASLAALSLLLCAVTIGLWIRSYRTAYLSSDSPKG